VITSIIIPVANPNTWQQIISLDFIVYAFSQFFFVAALCIAADMRDTEEDREDHIKTFPVVAGIELSKKLILLLLVFEIILLVILFQRSYLEVKQLESMILVSMLSMLVSYQLQSKNSYYYFVLIIDGLIAIQSCSILILQALNNW
jgi:1,4-dihydroxy-2-naphthoate octaprenyltransferase